MGDKPFRIQPIAASSPFYYQDWLCRSGRFWAHGSRSRIDRRLGSLNQEGIGETCNSAGADDPDNTYLVPPQCQEGGDSDKQGEPLEAAGERFDLAGSLLFVVSLGLLVYGFISLPKVPGFLLLAIGLIGVVAFVWFEGKIESPVLNVGVLGRNTVFIFSNVAR